MEIRTTDTNLRVRRQDSPKTVTRRGDGASFAQSLAKAERSLPLRFSRHAQSRMKSWGQELGQERTARLEGAVDAALAKGSTSALVLMKDVAFVVAPKTRTIVTVVPQERMKENVFTSIDSAILLDN